LVLSSRRKSILAVESTAHVPAPTDPISLDEASKLLHALANACERKPSGKALPDTLNWAKAKDLARTVLSAEHDAAFETMASRIRPNAKLTNT
jgi:hypothetical protein